MAPLTPAHHQHSSTPASSSSSSQHHRSQHRRQHQHHHNRRRPSKGPQEERSLSPPFKQQEEPYQRQQQEQHVDEERHYPAPAPPSPNGAYHKNSNESTSTAATSSTTAVEAAGQSLSHHQQLYPTYHHQQQQQQHPHHYHQEEAAGPLSNDAAATARRQSPESPVTTPHRSTSPRSPSLLSSSPSTAIASLQNALDQAHYREATAKKSLAQSDSVILELRSSLADMQQELQQIRQEQEQREQQQQQSSLDLVQESAVVVEANHGGIDDNDDVQTLRDKLHHAHTQIATADMVRRELEDTLEAEQYTWELRVQDQERQILQLSQDCTALKQELQQRQAGEDVYARLEKLESEREELQACLDEAMQEIEAVDSELRQHLPLQELYEWLLDRWHVDEEEKQDRLDMPKEPHSLVLRIQQIICEHADAPPPNGDNDSITIQELEAKLSVYRGDLKAREESSAELRASLKEAVALLKPLQDAVAKTDGEKKSLEEQLDVLERERNNIIREKNAEIAQLQDSVMSLQHKLKSPSSSLSPLARTSSSRTLDDDSERSNAKRRSEEKLQKLLQNAQSRFQQLHSENYDVLAENEELKRSLESAQTKLRDFAEEESVKRDVATEMREAAIQQLQRNVEDYSELLQQRDEELQTLKKELEAARTKAPALADDYQEMQMHVARETKAKTALQQDLHMTKEKLNLKTESERVLNKSLKEALGLLKPLQQHLETAEREKRDALKKLKAAKKRIGRLETSLSPPPPIAAAAQNQDQQQLQLYNPQANPAEQLVEVQSRYDVTRNKLLQVQTERAALIKSLEQKVEAEQVQRQEISNLKRKVSKSRHELENAKYIATSALMKVEELTMASIQTSSVTRVVSRSDVEVERLRQQVHSLEQEVDTARELNESLEESIQERDRILLELTTPPSSPPRNGNTASSNNNGSLYRGHWKT